MASSTQTCNPGQVPVCSSLGSISSTTDLEGESLRSGGSLPDPEMKAQGFSKDPIFAEGSHFEMAFKAFHGDDGVMPLKGSSDSTGGRKVMSCPFLRSASSCSAESGTGNPEGLAAALAASPLATIGLSAFGGGGLFGFDAFKEAMEARKHREKNAEQERQRQKEKQQRQERADASETEGNPHEAIGDDWLATGNCPIARSYRAFNRVVPALTAAFKPPQGIKYICPPAIVAMRAEVAKNPLMKTLRPQALPIRVLAIGTIGLFLNIPLGAWREHLVKFSPQWILVVHASVPFVAILRKAALMPKYAMAFTVAASIIGQSIGAKLERKRITRTATGDSSDSSGLTVRKRMASRRELGRGLRGLGVQRGEPMVAFDCHMESGSRNSSKPEPTSVMEKAQYGSLTPAAEMITAAA